MEFQNGILLGFFSENLTFVCSIVYMYYFKIAIERVYHYVVEF